MSLTLLLRCHEIETTRRFYQSVLGFEVHATAEGTLSVAHHGGVLIFTMADLWQQPPACSGTLYFRVPDVEAYFSQIKDQVAVVWPLQSMSYGSREFGVLDCNGYYLAFQQQV